MFYGNNDSKTLSGVIKEVQERMVKISFNTVHSKGKIVTVPKNIINSKFVMKAGVTQEFNIPTWFLKRNRVVPLNENLP